MDSSSLTTHLLYGSAAADDLYAGLGSFDAFSEEFLDYHHQCIFIPTQSRTAPAAASSPHQAVQHNSSSSILQNQGSISSSNLSQASRLAPTEVPHQFIVLSSAAEGHVEHHSSRYLPYEITTGHLQQQQQRQQQSRLMDSSPEVDAKPPAPAAAAAVAPGLAHHAVPNTPSPPQLAPLSTAIRQQQQPMVAPAVMQHFIPSKVPSIPTADAADGASLAPDNSMCSSRDAVAGGITPAAAAAAALGSRPATAAASSTQQQQQKKKKSLSAAGGGSCSRPIRGRSPRCRSRWHDEVQQLKAEVSLYVLDYFLNSDCGC
jgi:hypothetical protein